MRLGAHIWNFNTPEQWIKKLKEKHYGAAYCPVNEKIEKTIVAEYGAAARENNILISEVGAFTSNPISSDPQERKKSIQFCIDKLRLADEIGAICCVNIAGSRSLQWNGPCEENLSEATFRLIVQSIQQIIDEAAPRKAFYTLEILPWSYPFDADSYVRLIQEIDRKQFAVHLDIVNGITSPYLYFNNLAFVMDCFNKLGHMIKSCHLKDIILSPSLTVHLNETMPGKGNLNIREYLVQAEAIKKDIPMMLEHLKSEEEYDEATGYVLELGASCGINFVY